MKEAMLVNSYPHVQNRHMQKLKPVVSIWDELNPSRSSATDSGSSVTRPSRKRAYNPKTRTGCKTCKIRRVKCDESRPQCQRCIKLGTTCDGYLNFTTSSTTTTRRSILLPKASKLCRPAPLSCQRFESEQESHFFRLYCREVATQLPGPFKTVLWDRLIPQMCEAEPFVRHAVIGIGALNQVYREHGSRRRKGIYSSNQIHELKSREKLMYEFALKEYGKALKGMKKAIERKYDIRMALIACLLVFCFESLQGNPNAAVANAKSGLTVLQGFMASRGPHCIMTHCFDSYEGIEADIASAFAGLDIQVMFFLDTRTEDVHRAAIARFENSVANMPGVFKHLEECMAYWFTIQRRNYHFYILARDALSNPAVSARKQDQWRNQNLVANPARSGCFYDGTFQEPVEDFESRFRDTLRMQMEIYRDDIRRWSRASALVFGQVEAVGGKEQKVIKALLNIHANLSHIEGAGVFMAKDTEYDAFLPEFTTIVELSEEIYPYMSRDSNSVFRFFLGIVNPLSAVGFRCRNAHIRGRAIKLLQRGPYREGIWDALGVGKLADWIRGVEEEGMDENGYIPESKRAVMRLFDVDLNSKVALLGCKSPSEKGQKFIRKEVVE